MSSFIENNQRPGGTEVAQDPGHELLIVVDGLAGHLSFDNARIALLRKNEDFRHFVQQVKDGSLSVAGHKIIILLIGRGDIWDTDRQYFQGVEEVIRVIQNQNGCCILVLGATLPLTEASRPMVQSFTFRNDKLATRCTRETRLEHARPGKHLLGPHGLIEAYYDGDGNINDLGGDVIAKALERKIFSARLMQ